eukprot:jgi/Mesvir1/27192/Mv25638-RA.1
MICAQFYQFFHFHHGPDKSDNVSPQSAPDKSDDLLPLFYQKKLHQTEHFLSVFISFIRQNKPLSGHYRAIIRHLSGVHQDLSAFISVYQDLSGAKQGKSDNIRTRFTCEPLRRRGTIAS